MKVLLIQPKSPFPDNTYPYGIMYIDSYLKSEGIFSSILNLNNTELCYDAEVGLVGVSAYTICADEAIRLIPKLRTIYPNAKIILGGRHFTYLPEEGEEADGVVVGEGELVLKEICDNKFELPEKLIKGKEFKELDDIKLHDESLDIIYEGKQDSVTVIGSRGCVFNCVFCGDHSKRLRYNSPEYFVDLLEKLSRRYTNNIFIADDIFTVNKERTYKICELLIKKKLNIRLKIFGHINVFDKSLYKLMKKAGVGEICFGIESGNNEILKLIHKNFTIEKAYIVLQEVKKLGFQIRCMYMVGNIGETEKTIRDTIEFSNKVESDSKWVSLAIPLPGTHFYEVASNYGRIVKRPWSQFNNMNVCFVPNGLSESRLIQLKSEF